MVLDGAQLDAMLHGETTDPRTYMHKLGYKVPALAAVAADADPLPAEVRHGVWIALCPCGQIREGVYGGGVVWVDRPYVWCPLCRNKATGRRWRPVVLPAERMAIEAVLSVRPDAETQNWQPGESVADLLADNAAHGLEVG